MKVTPDSKREVQFVKRLFAKAKRIGELQVKCPACDRKFKRSIVDRPLAEMLALNAHNARKGLPCPQRVGVPSP